MGPVREKTFVRPYEVRPDSGSRAVDQGSGKSFQSPE